MNYAIWPTTALRAYYATLFFTGFLVWTQLAVLDELLRREREQDERNDAERRAGVNCETRGAA